SAQEVVHSYHLDALGRVQMVSTNAGGAPIIERHDYQPFGEECVTGACASTVVVNKNETARIRI
ncbi:MAG: hypothetical protein LC799_05995, partial [Actinobacteria bacterium]|nr:hypothetical protein [Actinomycetota bacterium]